MPPRSAPHHNANAIPEKATKPVVPISSSEKPVSAASVPVDALAKQDLSESLSRLNLKGQPDPLSNFIEHAPLEALRQSAKLDDEKTHLSVSSTKAPSLDSKSIASMATFAMDEKESIRPDDSASVQAAEDEDSISGPGSGAQNSRFGSESGSKAFHAQMQEISQEISSSQRGVPLPRRLGGIVAGPQASGIQQSDAGNTAPPNLGQQGIPMMPQFPFCVPDEKLLEALESAKDRLFLLQLEQQFISFIQDAQASSLDLPPYNSFFRLLAHRLGDYYKLSHWADSSTNAVRLYKTNDTLYAQLPTPLSEFRSKSSSEEAPSVPPSMKIMRRVEGAPSETQTGDSSGNTNVSSVVPSKAGSEVGDDSQKASGVASPTGSVTAKDKSTQTREEREAKYKEARDRIFGNWKESESGEGNPSAEASAQASRASSVNGRKKKKNQKNDDDGFQARSAYNVIYPGRQPAGFDPAGNPLAFFNPYIQQNGAQAFQPAYGQNFSPQYQPAQQSQYFSGQMLAQGPMAPNNMMMNPNTAQQPFMSYQMPQQPMMNQFYPQMHQPQAQMSFQPSMMQSSNPYGSQMPRPASQMSDQSWGQAGMQNPYQVYPPPANSFQPQAQQPMPQMPANHNNQGMPYPYGQLPYQSPSPSNRAAHPVPGSYNRQTFNAQSRVFVPGEAGFVSSGMNQAGSQNNFVGQPQGAAPGGAGFSYTMPAVSVNQLTTPPASTKSASPLKSPSHSAQSRSPGTSTISKWGTPSTLPPKPPPPATHNTVSSSMPTYQNGTYSKPTGAPQDAKAH